MSKLIQSLPVLAYPFRPFFLLTAIYAALSVIAWVCFFLGAISLPLGWSPLHWHSHEMLFGLIPAAIAGFLLTAICNWTGAAPLTPKGLFALMIIWLAGRLMMWTASWWPSGLVAAVDLLFLPAMAIYVLRLLLAHNNTRNLPIAGILVLLSIANLFMHIGFMSGDFYWLKQGELMALGLITLIMIVIGGRIIPLFTANWLRKNTIHADSVKIFPWLDRVTLIATALLIPADFVSSAPWLSALIAVIAGLLNAARLLGWSGWRAWRKPLLWILHIGYGWIVLALLLKGAAGFNLVAPSAWLHALGAGAMGTLILGVMARVALGHTGRAFNLPKFGLMIFVAISTAALTRLLVALHVVDYSAGLIIAAAAWAAAFCLFTLLYWPILTRPRVDDRPG